MADVDDTPPPLSFEQAVDEGNADVVRALLAEAEDARRGGAPVRPPHPQREDGVGQLRLAGRLQQPHRGGSHSA